MQFSAHLESERHYIIMSESLVVHIAIAEFQQYSKNWKRFLWHFTESWHFVKTSENFESVREKMNKNKNMNIFIFIP